MRFEYNDQNYQLNISNQTLVNMETLEITQLEDIRDLELIQILKNVIQCY